jgi:hypothetical protein
MHRRLTLRECRQRLSALFSAFVRVRCCSSKNAQLRPRALLQF